MHSKWLISNGNRIFCPVGIFANSNYLDFNLLAIYKNSNYFRCMKVTTKYLCTDVYNHRSVQGKEKVSTQKNEN